jgi:hypothetical protein
MKGPTVISQMPFSILSNIQVELVLVLHFVMQKDEHELYLQESPAANRVSTTA